MSSKSQFTGTAGEFYVAYQLTKREIHAAITLGNAAHVDILASSADGKRSLSIQVKTSNNAYRRKRYGYEGFEWDVNKGDWSNGPKYMDNIPYHCKGAVNYNYVIDKLDLPLMPITNGAKMKMVYFVLGAVVVRIIFTDL